MNIDRIKKWWHLWWDEIAIGVGVTVVLSLVICGAWYLFQTIPAPLEEGVVRSRDFTAQYSHEHDGGSTCMLKAENGITCLVSVDNPDYNHEHCVGGCYSIQVEGCSQNRRGDTICRREGIDVPESVYDNCDPGRYWREETACRPQ